MSRSVRSINIRKNSDPIIVTNKIQTNQRIKKQIIEQTSKVKSRYEEIRSARNPRTRKLSNELSHLQPSQSLRSSTSKFSQRHKNIIMSRTNMLDVEFLQTNNEQQKQKLDKKVQINRYGPTTLDDNMFTDLLKVNHIQKATQQLRKSGRKFRHPEHVNDSNNIIRIEKGVQYVELPKLKEDQLIFRKEKQNTDPKSKEQASQKMEIKQQKQKQLTGYWKKQNKFVSLTVLQKNEKLNFNHCNILPIYAEITINNTRYVISDEYKNFSLKHLIDQFGPFDENMSKRYLKQIAQGLQHMHYQKCGHNRLTTRSILYNKNGNIFINSINATSLLLSTKQLSSNQQLHYFSPQFLLSKSASSKSLKNDIWALGCIALQMFHFNIYHSKYHPYNVDSFKDENQERMIDNLRQICKNYFIQNQQNGKLKKNNRQSKIKLSQVALHFIESCLQIITDRRSTIEQLLEHQFFQGV